MTIDHVVVSQREKHRHTERDRDRQSDRVRERERDMQRQRQTHTLITIWQLGHRFCLSSAIKSQRHVDMELCFSRREIEPLQQCVKAFLPPPSPLSPLQLFSLPSRFLRLLKPVSIFVSTTTAFRSPAVSKQQQQTWKVTNSI